MNPDTWVLQTRAGPNALVEIVTALDRTWSLNPGVPDTVRMQMEIAAAEIGANIIDHATLGQPLRMWMDVRVLPLEVRIEFADEGRPLDIDLSAVCLPDDLAEHGRGLALAQAVLAKLTYHRDELNHWTLFSNPFG